MWLSDFRVVLPDRVIPRGSVRIEGGRIAELAETPVAGGIAGDGLLLCPGFIDMHGDMIEHEVEPRPRVDFPMEIAIQSLDRRLAGAGVTTGYASVSFTAGRAKGERRSYEHTSAVISGVAKARAGMRVDHRIHARFDIKLEDALGTIDALIRAGHVDLVSLMDHTPGQGQYRNLERFADQLCHIHGVTLAEAQRMIADRQAEAHRPEAVLHATLSEISGLCKAHGIPMASHDDDTEAKVALMASLGVRIAEFPVSEEAAAAAKAHGIAVAMGAPNALRGKSYSGNLSARAAHAAGQLDMLCADYHPGAILPAALILAETHTKGLPGAIAMTSTAPAQALGLSDRGEIKPGLRADLVVADDCGMGHVRMSFANGALAYSDGTLGAEAARAVA